MESILQSEKRCFLCGREVNLELHHAIHGVSNRKNADKYGLVVWLCQDCHTGTHGVHHNREKDLELIKYAQTRFESEYGSREEFRRIFGKSWL